MATRIGRYIVGASVVVLLQAGVLLAVAPDSAWAASCGTAQHLFSGRYYIPSVNDYGSFAQISVRDSTFCTGTGSGSTDISEWSMLAGSNAVNQYAQIGWIHKAYGSVHLRFFIEWDSGPWGSTEDSAQFFFGNPQLDTGYQFTVERLSDGHVYMYKDGQDPGCSPSPSCYTTTFDPYDSQYNWGTKQSQWFAEVQYPGDDVPGTSSYRSNFSDVAYRNSSGNWPSVTSFTGAGSGCDNYKANQVGSDNHFTVYQLNVGDGCPPPGP